MAKTSANIGFDPERMLTPTELHLIRGPFVRRPREEAPVTDWIRWAQEVNAEADLARQILAAADHATSASKPQSKRSR